MVQREENRAGVQWGWTWAEAQTAFRKVPSGLATALGLPQAISGPVRDQEGLGPRASSWS